MPRYLSIVSAFCCLSTVAQTQDIRVHPDGPVHSIAEAISRASIGGRVVVSAGMYLEGDLVIDKRLSLVGEPGAVIDGGGETQILTITADSVEVRGLTFQNVATSFVEDRAAIKVDEANHCTIAENTLLDTFFGIYLAQSANCLITGNVIQGAKSSESRSGNGIHLWYSKDVEVSNNDIRGHRDGIYLEFVEDSRVLENISAHNHRYGLHFMFSDRCSYEGNLLRDNDAGVAVMYTKNVHMEGNTFEYNWGGAAYGLLLKDITDSMVRNNRFVHNTTGIYLEGSNRVDVLQNEFSSNGWAVKIMANAEDNRFEGNSFMGNTFDVSTNSRMSHSSFSGNYWDNYEGYDLNRDGIGDVPFHPVRLFSLVVERNAPTLVLLRSFLVDLLDAAEQVFPVFTPETLTDDRPLMRRSL